MRAIFPLVLVVVGCLQSVRADESRTFCGRTVGGWIAVLRDPSSTDGVREKAVWALGCFGAEAGAAIPDLIGVVRQGQFKSEAVEALVRIGASAEVTIPPLIERFFEQGCSRLIGKGTFLFNPGVRDSLVMIGGPAVPALLEVMKGPDWAMRVCAAEAIGEIGPAARGAVPALIGAIEHPDDGREGELLGRYAVRALGRIGPEARAAVPTLTRLLENAKEDDEKLEAVKALDGIGGPFPIPRLVDDFLRRGDTFAAHELAWLGPKAREAAPSLRVALKDKRPQIRISAAAALAYIDPSTTAAIPVLIDALNRQDVPNSDVSAASALAQIGPVARAAMPGLIGIVKKGGADHEILKALVRIDPEGRESIPALISALKDEHYQDVEVAAQYLGLFGPRARAGTAALAEVVVRDFDDEFSDAYQPQVCAARTLRRIGPDARSAIPALIDAVKAHNKDETRNETAEAAAQVLGSFGDEARAAVPALIEAIQDDQGYDMWAVRRAASVALGRIGPAANGAIPALGKLLDEKSGSSFYQPEVVIALHHLAANGRAVAEWWLAKSANASATQGRRGNGREVERRALVLGAMGRATFETDWLTRGCLEKLDAALARSHPGFEEMGQIEYLEWRFEELARLGVAARAAIPRLQELRAYPEPRVRMWAAETLQQIIPPAHGKE